MATVGDVLAGGGTELARSVRAVLDDAGFTEAAIIAALGVSSMEALGTSDPAMVLRRSAGGSRLETLVRLLLLDIEVDAAPADAALHPMSAEQWLEAGLLSRSGERVRSALHLRPLAGLLVASDPRRPGDLGRDHVLGVGAASLTLAGLTVRRHSPATLDLGSGCGVQALLAARHSDVVVGVDSNPRAVGYTLFNAALNGLDNVSAHQGDLYDPVGARVFDLIVSNPPFVISPDSHYTYRDSGLGVDEICRRVVRQGAVHLTEGGILQMLCNWAHISGQDWHERLAAWFEGIGCDAWVMRVETQDVTTYATTWIRHTEPQGHFDTLYDQWMAHYSALGIEAVSSGVITLCRRDGDSWLRFDDGPHQITGPCGDAILRGLAAEDLLRSTSDAQLLEMRLSVAPDVRLTQELQPGAEGWEMAGATLRLARGLAYTGSIDGLGIMTLGLLDGRRTVGAALREVADSAGDETAMETGAALTRIRRLLQCGFLVPAEGRDR